MGVYRGGVRVCFIYVLKWDKRGEGGGGGTEIGKERGKERRWSRDTLIIEIV